MPPKKRAQTAAADAPAPKAKDKGKGKAKEKEETDKPAQHAPEKKLKKSSLPAPIDDEIAKRLGMNRFLSGVEYYEQNRIYFCRSVQDVENDDEAKTLKAKCKGTGPEPYLIEITFDGSSDIFKAKCTCPVGGQGSCKHVACTLLKWQEMQTTGHPKVRSKRSPEEQKLLQKKIDELSKKNVSELKEMLKANDQSTQGTKAELLEKIADGMCFGALPRCPKCSGGRLRFRQGIYYCPGYMEDDTFVECDFFSSDVKRNEWKMKTD